MYFSQKQLPRKIKLRLVIIVCAGLYFLAVVFATSKDIVSRVMERMTFVLKGTSV